MSRERSPRLRPVTTTPMPAADGDVSFAAAVAGIRALPVLAGMQIHEAPAPQRLAPHALALMAEVPADESEEAFDDDRATGRLVLLHDPHGQESWQGTFRVVTFVRAWIEPDIAADPLLHDIAWAWVTEALDDADAVYRERSGTVTRTQSVSFGGLIDVQPHGEVEIRCSWTADGPPEHMARHVSAWMSIVATAAGCEVAMRPDVAPRIGAP